MAFALFFHKYLIRKRYLLLSYIILLSLNVIAPIAFSNTCNEKLSDSSSIILDQMIHSLPVHWGLRELRFLTSAELNNSRFEILSWNWNWFQILSSYKNYDKKILFENLKETQSLYFSDENIKLINNLSDSEIVKLLEILKVQKKLLMTSHRLNPNDKKGSPIDLPKINYLKRNLDFLFLYVKRKYFLDLKTKAKELLNKNTYTEKDIVKIIDNYYFSPSKDSMQPLGGYSFQLVLDLARIFNKWTKEQQTQFTFAGSLPSGRGDLLVSDIDIYMAKKELHSFNKIRLEVEAEMNERIKIELPENLQSIRRKSFDFGPYEPADTYRRQIKAKTLASEDEVLGFMTPIILKLTSNQIEILIVDSVSINHKSETISLKLPITP